MVANWSGGVVANEIYVWTITGQGTNTPGDTKSWKTGDSAVTINVANAGCVFMMAGACDGTLGAMTLTGANIDDDQTLGGPVRSTAGSVTNLAADAARALAATSTANVEVFAAHTYS